jgi:apolipoprotein N-acyltransferase
LAVGAIPVLVNAGLAVTALRYVKGQARIGRRPHPELMLGMAAVLVAFVTGSNLARAPLPPGTPLRVALIQPAIPQEEKWSEDSVALIYERLRTLTAQAVLFTRPDLVVWPETALPDDVKFSEPSYELVDALSRLGTPVLVGSMDAEYLEGRRPLFYNVSFLFDTNGMITAEYRKQHLVLLGEYIPYHDTIPLLRAMTPNMESFTAGTTATVMRVRAAAGGEAAFSPLICFEDTFAYLGRRAVRAGARLLINQTNDAWFDPSSASRQHQIHSIFRAVEHRVPVVRAANTGYTCAIDARGSVHDVLRGADGGHDQPGFQLVTVEVPPAGHPPTFYTRHGDVFAWVCLFIAVVLSLPLLRRPVG